MEPPLRIVAESASTNSEVLAALAREGEAWPHLSALLARRQYAGRGRSGRSWSSEEVAALTFSVVVRPGPALADRATWGWIPMLAGVAVVRAIESLQGPTAEVTLGGEVATAGGASGGEEASPAGGTFRVKWPNDVVLVTEGAHLPGWGGLRKVAGILCEIAPDTGAVVVGIGVNLAGEHRPVPWAGTLADAGLAPPTGAELAGAIVRELGATLHAWERGKEPGQIVAPWCTTIGSDVRVDLPGGDTFGGRAIGLGPSGELLVATPAGTRAVLAGDVAHVRVPERGSGHLPPAGRSR